MGAATDFVKALLVGRYADPGDADDLMRIETSFHEWIRGNLMRMDLIRPADFASFVTDEFAPLAEAYCTLFRAAQSPDSNTDLHSLFFNNVNGIGNQFQLIFAAVRRGDSPDQIRAKARRVADYLDLLYVHRIISGHSAHPSELDIAIRDLIPKLRDAGDLEAVTGLLGAELSADPGDFADVRTFSLGADNRRQVHYLLARLTAFTETECGRPNRVGEYLDEQRSHQIEHIWANHFDRYRDLVKSPAAFDRSRNRFGALLLLHRSDNASYRDEPYSAKVEYYRGSEPPRGVPAPGDPQAEPGIQPLPQAVRPRGAHAVLPDGLRRQGDPHPPGPLPAPVRNHLGPGPARCSRSRRPAGSPARHTAHAPATESTSRGSCRPGC